MTVKIAATLPKEHARNAFMSRHTGEWKSGRDDLVVVAFLRPRSAKQMLGGFDGDDILELAVVRIETLEAEAREVASALLFEASEARTGMVPLAPVVGPFVVTCEACEGTGDETQWFEEDEWTRDCRPCAGTGSITYPNEDVGRVVVWFLGGIPVPDEDEAEAA